jgi:arsenate reductase
MAQGWAEYFKSDVIESYSAGIAPRGLDRLAVKVMAEAGVDISAHKSKHLDEVKDIVFDYVITVCDNARERCPYFPGKAKIIHVGFDDPPKLAANAATEEEALNYYRQIRDEIRNFVLELPDKLKRL